MIRDEFYADPTLFDHWRDGIAIRLEQQAARLRPYAWVLAFALPAVLLGAISLVEFVAFLHSLSQGSHAAWNQIFADVITLAAALVAMRLLLQRALEAWPAVQPLPHRLGAVAKHLGLRLPRIERRTVERRGTERCSTERRAGSDSNASFRERQALMAFFSGVKAAGVNVRIARALLKAGIRSPRQLQQASDRQLAAIHGVGVATVRKLRRQFPADAN